MRTFISYFQFINYYFGHSTMCAFKDWIKLQKSMIRAKLKINFLRKCINHNITLPSLSKIWITFERNLCHDKSRVKLVNMKSIFIGRLLRLQIRDLFFKIRSIKNLILVNSRFLYQHTPVSVCNAFFRRQLGPLHSVFNSEQNRLNKKFYFLNMKQSALFNRTTFIKYSYNFSTPNHKRVSFHLKQDTTTHKLPTHGGEVNVTPDSFDNNQRGLFGLREDWFVNLSGVDVPRDVQSLLQLGENFSMPITDGEFLTVDFLKNFENSLRKLPSAKRYEIKNRSAHIIDGLPLFSPPTDPFDFKQLFKNTKKFLHDHPNLLITRADKGNVTVALSRDDYVSKIEGMLSDINTYKKIVKSPINKLICGLKDILIRWKNSEYINTQKYKSLLFTDGSLPRAYGLPKIHKQNCPFRIIVSSVDSPLYDLAAYLHDILNKSFPKKESQIINSFQLVKLLSNLNITDCSSELISLDVVSLFTNIPLQNAIESVANRWNLISENTSIPKDEFLGAVNFVLRSTFFTFNNNIYEQTYGTPMGSPLSPIIAEIVLQDIEDKALNSLKFVPSIYYRYVDDILMIIPNNMIEHTVQSFNSLHHRIQFTLEKSDKNVLNFLDVTLILKDNCLTMDWFHKKTFSGRYLNFFSQHPLNQKRGTIFGLVDRVFYLSNPVFHEKNIKFIINILLNNCYPLELIFRTIRERLKFLFDRHNYSEITNTSSTSNNNNRDDDRNSTFFLLPYVPSLSDRFLRVAGESGVRLAFYSINKLQSLIKGHKDRINYEDQKNVVYKINCSNCHVSYVGQTKRKLRTRIAEHRNDIRKNANNLSVISTHRLNFNHDFDWNNVRVLDKERSYCKRLISEMIHIKKQKEGINLQTDTENLDEIYSTIVDKLPKI